MYEMNELIPVVALLTRQYTGIESSSVTYEKANQLMEAVIYCIRELEQSGDDLLTSRQQSAMQAYKTGAQLVRRKTEDLLAFYERNKQKFSAYGNGYLADILQRGLPAFFENYNEKYDPQNTILTLDYPLLVDLTAYQGIDCVDLYVRSLAEEQQFLAKYGEEYVQSVLRSYSEDYEELPENIASIVFGNIIGHLLAGRGLSGKLCGTDLQGIYAQYRFCENEKSGGFREKVSGLAAAFLTQYYAGAEQTQRYMMAGLPDICTRIGIAAAHRNLDNIFVF